MIREIFKVMKILAILRFPEVFAEALEVSERSGRLRGKIFNKLHKKRSGEFRGMTK